MPTFDFVSEELNEKGLYKKIAASHIGLMCLMVQTASIHSMVNRIVDWLVGLFSLEHRYPFFSDVVILGAFSSEDNTVEGIFYN